MSLWKKAAIAGGVAYAVLVLRQLSTGQGFGWALMHPLGGSMRDTAAEGRSRLDALAAANPLPEQRSTAVVLDLFKGAPVRTKALTNAFKR